ncbi:MAG: enoyl-CoA hydratase/isomerase family protein [Ectothiorhodospiraceae bacterium]
MTTVTYERSGRVATVSLNRPERLNAISTGLVEDLHQALVEAHADESTDVIVLRGEGRAFCAGDDLKEFDDQARNPATVDRHVLGIQQITRDLMFGPKFVVGAIRGYAVGGGFEWMLNCDLTVAGDDLVAFFPEMDWGQFVTGGVTHLLPLAVGYQRAMELLVLGERHSAEDLLRLGLVNRVVPAAAVDDRAREIAERVAGKSSKSVADLKRLVTRGTSSALVAALEQEQERTLAAFRRPEARERVKRFEERRDS